uniref:Uncharacterized protein n=1 Tax=Calcidiscus leptoporus TaxID=127549 RepID=A0A7S0IYD1_9EUKA
MSASTKAKFMLVSNNEDFRVEVACLNRLKAPPNSLRVAMVTGGADTTLTALLHPSVASVLSFDPSPLQLHLLQLKLAVATSDLSDEAAVGFLLRGEGGKQVFEEKLVPRLPEETVGFFRGAGEDEIDKGILRADNDGPFNKILRAWFADEHGVDLSKWHAMGEAEKDKVLHICAANDSTTLATALQTFFKGAPWFKAMPAETQHVILGALGVAAASTLSGTGKVLSDIDCGLLPKDEFFTDIVLTASPKTLPPWMTHAGRRVLKAKASALTTFQGKADAVRDDDKFDFVSLSNIYDFSLVEAAVKDVRAVAAAMLKPNGTLLVRRAVGSAGAILKQAGGKQLEGEALENLDYNSLFYRSPGTVAAASFAAGEDGCIAQ